MKIVDYDERKHYCIMLILWLKRDWEPCQPDSLPRCGKVAESDDGSFLAYMGIYIDDGKIGLIGWALTDPDSNPILSDRALHKLFDTLKEEAKNKECKMLFSFTDVEPWGERLMYYGMKPTEKNITCYTTRLEGE